MFHMKHPRKKNMKIKCEGWPWQYTSNHWSHAVDKTHGQKYGWNPFNVKGMGRFGGGWAFKFGITINESISDIVLDLGIGSIRIKKGKK